MKREILRKEIIFKAVRSGGAGGQHVNKVSSKVVLFWNIEQTEALSDFEKELITTKLQNKFSKDGTLIIAADESRSQIKNKEIVVNRFFNLLEGALQIDKVRIKTKIPKSVVRKHKEAKQKLSLKKSLRKRPL